MANSSHIEWTDATWNPVTGCNKISPGCKFCYAERMSKRLTMGQSNYRNGFKLTLQPQMLEHPLHWRQPRRIFVNSMSDLFHVDVPLAYIKRVFQVMTRAHWHEYQVLTNALTGFVTSIPISSGSRKSGWESASKTKITSSGPTT